jgi:hypothetical protein
MTKIVLEVSGLGTVAIESLPDPCQTSWQGSYLERVQRGESYLQPIQSTPGIFIENQFRTILVIHPAVCNIRFPVDC